MQFPHISRFPNRILFDFVVIVIVNALLFTSVSSIQGGVENGNSQPRLEQKTHRTHPQNETAPIPIVKELGNFLTWFFGMPDEHNSTIKINSSGVESSSLRSTIATDSTTELTTSRVVKITSVNSSNNYNESSTPQRRVQVVPRHARKVDSNSPNGRQIEITDIQTSIGTELDEGDSMQNPSQVNLQDELESIDKFERRVAQDYPNVQETNTKRSKRDIPIHGITRPYINPGNTNFQRAFANRQGFLINPAQQVLALQQQQAAALLQQQAIRQGIGYRRPYFYDDYDDSDYDDSDSFEDDFGFFNPVRDGMRRGQFFPPGIRPPFMGGIGRRSVDEKLAKPAYVSNEDYDKTVESPMLKLKSARKHSSTGPLRRDGEWALIDDYDLSSDFHRARKRFGNGRQDQLEDNISYKKGAFPLGKSKSGKKKPSDGKRWGKQGGNETTTTESSSTTSNLLTTLAPGGGLSTLAPGGSTNLPSSPVTVPTLSPVNGTSMNPLSNTSLPINSTLSSTTPSMNLNSSTTASPTLGNSTENTTAKPMGEKPPYKANANCRCGAQSVRGEMITRGTVIRVHTNPWLFAISNKNSHLCTGTLINNKYILTAAQCVHGVNKKQLTVKGGLATRSSNNFTVSRIIIHPHYSPSDSTAHDLALLKLNNPVSINQMTRPICLPLSSQSRGKYSSGTLNTWVQKSSQLQMLQTDVKISEHDKCSASVADYSPGQLCTTPPGKTDCGGDSGGRGGSLQVTSGDFSYDQIGIVSSTIGCRSDNSPGVYTDIRNYTRWILTQTKDAKYCNKPKIKQMDLATLNDIETRSDFDEEEVEEDDDAFENFF